MASERQKLLVAVDGSEQSLEVVRYVAGICAARNLATASFTSVKSISASVPSVNRSLKRCPKKAVQTWRTTFSAM